jgi:hypothetical protein
MSSLKSKHQVTAVDNGTSKETDLVLYLNDCRINDQDPVVEFTLEGPCCRANGIYHILDKFCSHYDFDPHRITIRTSNMMEQHDQYRIEKIPEYWYEVREINSWLKKNQLDTGTTPTKHFALFIGRSTWFRLWIAALMNQHFADKTLLTFNSGIRSNYVIKNHGYDRLGLDDLVANGCDMIGEVARFLETCPRTLDVDNLKNIPSTYIPQKTIFPIQHPANLNLLKYYQDIFVDIICETRANGVLFCPTEKIWRCMVARRPFVVIGPQYYLQNLKRLGFLTFNDFWDEGYNEYPPNQQIKQLEPVLDTIASYKIDHLSQKLTDMQSILDHNYETFSKLTFQQIADVFDGK